MRVDIAWDKWNRCSGVICDKGMPWKQQVKIYRTKRRGQDSCWGGASGRDATQACISGAHVGSCRESLAALSAESWMVSQSEIKIAKKDRLNFIWGGFL